MGVESKKTERGRNILTEIWKCEGKIEENERNDGEIDGQSDVVTEKWSEGTRERGYE